MKGARWLLLFWVARAAAQVCECGGPPEHEYGHSNFGWYAEKQAACQAAVDYTQAQWTATRVYGPPTVNNPTPGQSSSCGGQYTVISNGNQFPYSLSISVRAGQNCLPCPPEEECEADLGDGYWTASNSPVAGGSWCDGGCEMQAGSSQCSGPPELLTCLTWTSVVALTCEGGGSGSSGDPADDPPAGATPDEDGPTGDGGGEECMSVGDGQYCASKGPASGDGGDCGYFNDDYVCLDKIREDECWVHSDGSRICGGAANTTPPAPDSGTPGEVASPDGQMSNASPGGVTNNYNYYNNVTVGGSSRDPGTTGAAPSSGSPHAPGPGDADGDGEEDCVGETCGEDLPELEDIGTMTDAFTEFWTNLQAVPIVAAAADVAPSFGTGSCPAWNETIAYSGQSIEVSFDAICTTYADISPAITVVALVLWGFLAYRILMSA